MAWNEPGGNNNNNDPWGNRNNSGGPPDLDEVFKNIKKKIDALLGGKGGGGNSFGEQNQSGGGQNGSGNNWGSGSGSKGPGFPNGVSPMLVGIVAFALLCLWLFSGIFILQPAEQGVITQFGRYKKTVASGCGCPGRFRTSKYSMLNKSVLSD